MKTTIITSTTSTTGYAIQFDGKTIDINATDPKNDQILKLPENPSNRKWFSVSKIEKAGGSIELDYKESKHFGQTTRKIDKGTWLDYLTDDEKAQLEELKETATRRMNDPLEIARRNYEKAMAEYNALLVKESDPDEDLGELED